jgi:hypothetical protein
VSKIMSKSAPRKFNPEKASRALKRAAQMPALLHTLPDQQFDLTKSEVVRWLIEQPEIQQGLFDWCINRGAIVFDAATHQWKGCDTP